MDDKEGTYIVQVEIQLGTDEQIEAIEAFIHATPEERARLLFLGWVTRSIMAQVYPALIVIKESPRHAVS